VAFIGLSPGTSLANRSEVRRPVPRRTCLENQNLSQVVVSFLY
jgi:hypothetical protein